MSNTEALKIARDALELASDIADRVPTRWHELNPSNSPAEHDIGCMVNAQPDGQHGYRLIHDALSAVRTALAQPQPSAPTETSGQRAAWTAVMQALDEVSPGWCKGADTPMSQAVAAIRWMAQPSAPSVEPVAVLREKLIDTIAESLDGALFCNRIWSAWHVGTMTEDDFSSVSESDKPAELADIAMSIIGAAPLMANGLTEAETAATASVAGLQNRTLLQQYDREQLPGYHAGYEDGRLKGYEVGKRHAAPQEAPVAPDGRLHADGYFTWARRDGYVLDRKLPCDFWLTPPAASAPTVQPLPARLVRFTLRDLKAERKRLDGFISLGNEIERAAEYDEWIAALEAYCTAHGITAATTKE